MSAMKTKLTEEQKKILKKCLWDMTISPEEYYDVIKGRRKEPWPDRAYCVARLLEYVNWYRIVKVFKPEEICALWTPEVRRYVRTNSTKEGMDFVCRFLQIHAGTLSNPG